MEKSHFWAILSHFSTPLLGFLSRNREKEPGRKRPKRRTGDSYRSTFSIFLPL